MPTIAVIERFYLNSEMERVWQRHDANQAEARLDFGADILGFSNTIRLHSTLGYLSQLASS